MEFRFRTTQKKKKKFENFISVTNNIRKWIKQNVDRNILKYS